MYNGNTRTKPVRDSLHGHLRHDVASSMEVTNRAGTESVCSSRLYNLRSVSKRNDTHPEG